MKFVTWDGASAFFDFTLMLCDVVVYASKNTPEPDVMVYEYERPK